MIVEQDVSDSFFLSFFLYIYRSKRWPLHKILCLRVLTRSGVRDAGHSIVVEVDLQGAVDAESELEMPQCLGWEKNERGKMGPRVVNLSSTMDPTK